MNNKAIIDLGECYQLRPSASVDNTLLDLQNSSYPTQPHSIIGKYYVYIAMYIYIFIYRQNKCGKPHDDLQSRRIQEGYNASM